MVAHIKNCHGNVRGIADKQYCNTCLYKITEEKLASHFMHIVLIHYHGNQLIAENRTDNHPRYGHHDCVWQVVYHGKNTCVPRAGCLPNLSGDCSYFRIHVSKHRFEIVQHPSLQHFLYKFSDFVNDWPHELWEQRWKLWNHRLCYDNDTASGHKLFDTLRLCWCVIKK